MKRWRVIVYSLVGIFVAFVAVIGYLRDKDYSITTLTSKTGYVFDIRTPYFCEMAQVVYCQLRKDHEIISSAMIGTTGVATDTLKFSLIERDDGLVVITEHANPHRVVVIFDAKHQTGYPFSTPKIRWEDNRKIGEELVQRLNTTTQGKPFVLGSGPLGWPIQKKGKNTNTFGEADE